MPKIHDKAIIRLDLDEVARLLDYIENCGDKLSGQKRAYYEKTKERDLTIITLLLGTGLRVSECVGLDIEEYANPVLLIIDEWLLLKITESEQHDILELLHRRRRKSSTIFCSRYDCNGWYDQLGGDDSSLSEAILDRIKHDAYKINIIQTDPTNYKSMREVYGFAPALSE